MIIAAKSNTLNLYPHETERALCAMPAIPSAVPLVRRFARDAARRWALDDECHDALAVVVTELVTNVVRHSGSFDVAVLLTTDGRNVTVHVQDSGRWRPRRARLASDGADACCGRGLRMVNAYAPDYVIVRSAHGTRVEATLTPDAGARWEPPGVDVNVDYGVG